MTMHSKADHDIYMKDPEYQRTPLVSPHPPPRLTPPRHFNDRSRVQQRPTQSMPHGSRPQPQLFRTDKRVPESQDVRWLAHGTEDDASWRDHLTVGIEKVREPDYDTFCDKDVADTLVLAKAKLGQLSPQKLHHARSMSNPYELIGKSVFVNRSAVKMAELDSLCELSDVYKRTGGPFLRFADICSGPGGFTEYLLWRLNTRKLEGRGWGLTLKGDQDFALDAMNPSIRAKELFKPYYGEDGTGNIYKNDTIQGFATLVKSETDGQGVDLVMADGGFCVTGDEVHQEEHSQQLALCQVATALAILQPNGDLVLKVFDLFTPFMAELVYILYRCFEKITLLKPFTSRPANAERYLIARGMQRESIDRVLEHLYSVNARINSLKPADVASRPLVSSHLDHQPGFQPLESKIHFGVEEVSHVLDVDAVLRDDRFMSYYKMANMKSAIRQTEALEELLAYAANVNMPGYNQEDVSYRCLHEWRLPTPAPQHDRDRTRSRPSDNGYRGSNGHSGYHRHRK
ncbi:FtsJ methyltransferase domain-containing protein 2 [Gaertneriomyces sp. JEL0708]|nr:FtsJ methyltransferase domain-containing protein 2 [Gaertneriomyces sp. JEL0708]